MSKNFKREEDLAFLLSAGTVPNEKLRNLATKEEAKFLSLIFKDKELAISVLRKRIPSMTQEDAEKLYPRLVGPGGLIPHSAMDIKGVKTVLKIRETYGEPRKKMGPISRYVDTSYYKRALAKAPAAAAKK